MLLASVFTDMERSLMMTLTVIGFAICLTIGYMLLRQANMEKEKKEQKEKQEKALMTWQHIMYSE